jgi:hypothetical protein
VPEAGYSGTPLARKLGIGDDSLWAAVDLPGPVVPGDDAAELVAGFPGQRAEWTGTGPGDELDVVLLFATRLEALAPRFLELTEVLTPAGGLWVAYPKRAAKAPTDLTFENVQAVGLEAGLVDNKSCAVSHVWSGVRFVYRLADRPGLIARRAAGGER